MKKTTKNLIKKLCLLFVAITLASAVWAQQTITGKVVDDTGEPLPGVSVVVEGTTSGTVTNAEGEYSLSVASDAVLIFSFMGMQTVNEQVNGRTSIDVVMRTDAIGLEEVVAIGYGTEKKLNLTGSVGSIKSDELVQVPTANTTNLLSGKIPGIFVKQNSGLPGSENTTVNIRGYGNPLVLVDGMEVDGGLARTDPNEIESISVLKDAAAAIYGSRAANGVILITTKRGTSSAPTITYDGSMTFQEATSFQEYVNPGQFIELVREADFNDNGDFDLTYSEEEMAKYYAGDPGYEGGNWVDALIDNFAPMSQHSLKVSGGAENIRFFASAGATNQESYFAARDHDYKRYNVRTNIDADVSKYLSFNIDLSYRREVRDVARDVNGIFNDLATAHPIYPTELPDPGIGVAYSGFSQRNPVASSDRDIWGWDNRLDHTFTGKIGIQYKMPFVEGLKFKAELNTVRLNRSIKKFRDSYHVFQYDVETGEYIDQGFNTPPSNTSIQDEELRRDQIYPLVSMEYEKDFGEHHIKFLALGEKTIIESSLLRASRTNLLSTSIPEIFSGSEEFDETFGNSTSDAGRKSFVSRLNYRLKDRYLFEATFRADGDVLFADQTRWGYFPSFSAGWIMSNEGFMQNIDKVLSKLKLRISYTELGDSRADGINGFDYLQGYSQFYTNDNGDLVQVPSYLLGGELLPGIRTLGLANPELTWVKAKTYNVGIEAGFFDNKLQLITDFFYRKRDGLLGQNTQAIPSTFGAVLPLVNLNSDSNRGVEIQVSYQERFGDFQFNISSNVGLAKAKWEKVLDEEDFTDPDQLRIEGKEGQWKNRNFGYVSDGIFMSQEEIDNYPIIQDELDNSTLRPGDIKYVDIDGNDTINFRDQRVIAYANELPELTYGMNIGASYKNFSLSMLFQGASKFSLNITSAARAMFSNNSTPFSYHYDYRWQPNPDDPTTNINPNAKLPAASTTTSSNNNKNSDFWRKDVTYLRLKTINLSYTLPQKIVSDIGLANVQFYVAGENLFTLSNLGIYKNSFDPESTGTNASRTYPINRNYTAGVRVTF
ncbi:MAG: SusC/RagA family TonB-linked outer membrane protein [Draconibacterium sp.]